jgi:hypothetical protein
VCTKVLSHAAKTSAGRYALTNKDRVPAQFVLNQATLHSLTHSILSHAQFVYLWLFHVQGCSMFVLLYV